VRIRATARRIACRRIEKTVRIEQPEGCCRDRRTEGERSRVRRLPSFLLGLTIALVSASVVLTVAGLEQNGELRNDWKSNVLLTGIGCAAALLNVIVGLLIARAEPTNAVAWIFLVGGTLLAAVATAFALRDFTDNDGADRMISTWAVWFGSWAFVGAVFAPPALIAQLFPTGRPLPGKWRWVLWASLAVAAESLLVAGLDPSVLSETPTERHNPLHVPHTIADAAGALNDVSGTLFAPVVLAASLAALVVRFRRSRGIERQQMKWLAFAGSIPVGAFTLSFLLSTASVEGLLINVVFVTGFAALTLIPVAVAIAILRYRLYEIDRVISRTLVYAALTVILGAAYAGLVLAGQAVFSSFAGGSNLAIAVSTLVVAALFLPLRSRVQRVVDRRFNRRRYDAQRTLEAFGARLREEIDLDALTSDLRRAVQETMQPARSSVWLREARP
jgi:hypothetical protein